jgi:ABC-type branched-subunit amino acid transport system substrate-binding protein
MKGHINTHKTWLICVFFAALAGVGATSVSESPIGGTKGEIVFGMSTVLSGPAADLGLNMRAGVLAALDEANRNGGVHGQTLRLIALDDGYEPARTGPNMRTLIGNDQVIAVVGNVGTPTAVAAIPIAMEGKMPLLRRLHRRRRAAQGLRRIDTSSIIAPATQKRPARWSMR